MRLSNKKIKRHFRKQLEFSCNQMKIQETAERSRKAFYQNEADWSLSRSEFLYQQSRYIPKRLWIMQGILLLTLWWILKYADSSFYMQRSLGIAAPLFVVLIIPALWKNRNANALEVESTTYYSLRQIYAARMELFALTDIVFLSLFFLITLFTTRMSIGEMMIQFFIPLTVTCCICFRTLYSRKLGSEIFALFLSMVWIVIWLQIVLNERVYRVVSAPAWGFLLLSSLLYLGYSIRMGQKNCKELWEVKPSWN